MTPSAHPRQHIINIAANWMARLWSDQVTDADRKACEQWRQQAEEHEQAWQALLDISGKFDLLPEQHLQSDVLTQSSPNRRQFLQWMGVIIASSSTGYGIHQTGALQQLTADYTTAVGQSHKIVLADSSEVYLNTDTALDVRFDPQQRLLTLHRGELFIRTGHNSAYIGQPFRVKTADGTIEALGTAFNVHKVDNATEVFVTEASVLVSNSQQQQPLHAGEQLRFDQNSISSRQTISSTRSSWTQKKLVAEQMPLQQFISELQRYRHGILRCDSAIAYLKISGVFPLDDTDRALTNLTQALPVKIQRRTGLWVSVIPVDNDHG